MVPFKESILCLLSAKQYSGIEKYSGKAEHRVTAIVELMFAWWHSEIYLITGI